VNLRNISLTDLGELYKVAVLKESEWLARFLVYKADTRFAIPDVDGCLKVVTGSSHVL